MKAPNPNPKRTPITASSHRLPRKGKRNTARASTVMKGRMTLRRPIRSESFPTITRLMIVLAA